MAPMLAELPARGVRIGGVTVMPGEARPVAIPLAPRGRRAEGAAAGADPEAARPQPAGRSVPAWVVVGGKPGPRVSIVAAPRGHEATAARAATRLASEIDPATLSGSVVIVPVMRAQGRLTTTRRSASRWRFPGDPGGDRDARDAFALFSNVVVGVQALVVLGGPRRGRRGALVARGDLEDPRVRRLAALSGAAVVLPAAERPGGLPAAAASVRIPCLELSADGDGGTVQTADVLARAARSALETLGVLAKSDGDDLASIATLPRAGGGEGRAAPAPAGSPIRVRAPHDGFLEAAVAPGTAVRSGAPLGQLISMLPAPATTVPSPAHALVIEAAPPGPVRGGATLFVMVPISQAAARKAGGRGGEGADGIGVEEKIRVGWVEYVALPGLGIERLKAKIDTGARTSALHVARMRTVDTTGGPNRRPILEITVPAGGRGRRPHRIRAAVRGFAVVRDTSGRTERRPVIETVLRVGTIKRRIAVTLTNRGDMLFPMLIGRTALGPGIVVDPARRYLLNPKSSAGAPAKLPGRVQI